MEDKNTLLKKLTKAQIKVNELENHIKENKAKEEKHRKNALITNCAMFGLHMIFAALGQPLLIVGALLYNLINMIVRATLMFKAEDNQEKAELCLKDYKKLITMYENEIKNYMQDIPLSEEANFSKINETSIELTQKDNKQNKKR